MHMWRNTHVERHLASIDEYTRQSEKMISETLDKQQTKEATLHSIQLYGEHLSKGSAYDLNTNVRSLLNKSEEEVGKAVLELKWNVDVTWSDWEVKYKVERVMLVKECQVKVKSDQHLTTVTAQSLTHDDQRVKQLNTFPTKCDNDVRGMVSYHNQMSLIHPWDGTLYVYDDTGKLIRSVPMFCHKNKSKMHTPYGMCLVQGEIDSLVISDNTGQWLWWLTTEKQASDVKLGQPRHDKLEYMPYGVSTDRSGRVVVTDCKNNCVYFYSHPGQHVTCLQLSRDVNPWQALIGHSDGYVIRHDHPIPCQLLWVNGAIDEAHSYTDQPDVRPHHMIDDDTYLLEGGQT